MSERDELARTLQFAKELADPNWSLSVPHIAKQAIARLVEIIEAKPRTITTAEELDALPVGSILLDRTGDTARKFLGGWRTTVVEPDGSAWLSGHMEDADLPATVLHEGA